MSHLPWQGSVETTPDRCAPLALRRYLADQRPDPWLTSDSSLSWRRPPVRSERSCTARPAGPDLGRCCDVVFNIAAINGQQCAALRLRQPTVGHDCRLGRLVIV